MNAKRKSNGLDWLTLVSADDGVMEKWHQCIATQFVDRKLWKENSKTRNVMGYVGPQFEGLFIGSRPDGHMVRVSSDTARWVGHDLLRRGGRASRIDLQITVWLGGIQDAFLRSDFVTACQHKYGRGSPPRIAIIDTNRGPEGVTIGSRASESYGRIYDKQKESKEERYEGCLRYEVEFKGELAHSIGAILAGYTSPLIAMSDMVEKWFMARGVLIPDGGGKVQDLIPLKRPPTSLERSRGWITRNIAPTIYKIALEQGICQTMLDVFGQTLDDEVIMRLVDRAALDWSS